MEQLDILTSVSEELKKRKGHLRTISVETGVGYDTVQRIKDGDPHDPGHSKVMRLYTYLFPKKRRKV